MGKYYSVYPSRSFFVMPAKNTERKTNRRGSTVVMGISRKYKNQ
jgi:hypothetical protein